MQRIVPALVAVALAACGGEGTGDGTSGIRGQALAGPQCAVEMAESPCPDLPWEGTVVATDTASGEEFTATTDADGRFELILAPGTYEVSIDVELFAAVRGTPDGDGRLGRVRRGRPVRRHRHPVAASVAAEPGATLADVLGRVLPGPVASLHRHSVALRMGTPWP